MLPLWRSINSINLMLPKEERKATLLRLFNDESELVDHAKDRERAAAALKAEAAYAEVKGEEKTGDVKTNGKHEMSVKEVLSEGQVETEGEDANGVKAEDTNGAVTAS